MLPLVSYDISSSDEADCSSNEDEDCKIIENETLLDDESIVSLLLRELVNKISVETPGFIQDRIGTVDMRWRAKTGKAENGGKVRRKRRRDEIGDEKSTTDWSDLDSWSNDSSTSSDSDCAVKVGKKKEPERKKESDHEFSDDSDYVYSRIVLETEKRRLNQKTGTFRKPPKTKGELDLDDLPPIEQLRISIPGNANLRRVGIVSSIVEKLVIVQSDYGVPPLDEESWLVDENRQPIGQIFEVFGPVPRPFYSVRFNKEDDARQLLSVGSRVFFIPDNEELTRTIFADSLRRLKGSDASWEDNNEPPAEALEFSDDEEEREWRRQLKAKNTEDKADDEAEMEVSTRPKAKPRRRIQRGRGARNPDSGSGTAFQHGRNAEFEYPRFQNPERQLFPVGSTMQNPWAPFDSSRYSGPSFSNFSPMMAPRFAQGPQQNWQFRGQGFGAPSFRAPFPPTMQRPMFGGGPMARPRFSGPPNRGGERPLIDTRYLQK